MFSFIGNILTVAHYAWIKGEVMLIMYFIPAGIHFLQEEKVKGLTSESFC